MFPTFITYAYICICICIWKWSLLLWPLFVWFWCRIYGFLFPFFLLLLLLMQAKSSKNCINATSVHRTLIASRIYIYTWSIEMWIRWLGHTLNKNRYAWCYVCIRDTWAIHPISSIQSVENIILSYVFFCYWTMFALTWLTRSFTLFKTVCVCVCVWGDSFALL